MAMAFSTSTSSRCFSVSLSLVIQLPFSIAKDVRRRKALRYGRRLKGPEMMTPKEFNNRVAGDGIGIKTDEMKAMIRIPQRAEAQHMQIIGDTGAGKTMIMLQILRQIKTSWRFRDRLRPRTGVRPALLRPEERRRDPESAR